MYRKTAIVLFLALAGCGLAAMVKAQDSGQGSHSQPTLLEQVSGARGVERIPATPTSGDVMQVQATEPIESASDRGNLLEERLRALRDSVLGEPSTPSQEPQPQAAPAQQSPGQPHPAVPPVTQAAAPVTEMPSVLGSHESSEPRVAEAPQESQETEAPASSRRTYGQSEPTTQAPAIAAPAQQRPVQTPSAGGATAPSVATAPRDDPFNREGTIPDTAPLRVAEARTTIEGSESLLTSRGPTLDVVTVGPEAIVLGKQAVFRVTVENTTDIEAHDVIFSVPLPAGVDLAHNEVTSGQAAYEAAVSGGAVVWRMPQLPARGRAQLSLSVIPRDTDPVDLQVTWTASSISRVTSIAVLEPKLEIMVSGPVDIVYGSNNVYTIVVSNPGEAAADNVILTLPAVAENGEGGTARMLGTIPAGERRTIQFELTARQEGSLPIRAKVVGDGGLEAETQRDVLVRRGVLELVLQGPGARYASTPADYHLVLSNTGNASADQVYVKAALPEGSTFLVASAGGQYNQETHSVEWEFGALHPAADHTLTVQAMLTTAGENHLNVQSESSDGLSVFETLTTHVEPIADVKLVVNDPPGPVAVGEEAHYEVTVQNRGTRAAENVRVVAYFDEGVDPISATGAQASINLAEGQVIFQALPTLAAGEEVTLRIAAKARIAGSLQFRAEVECTNPQTRLSADESTVFYSLSTTSSAAEAGPAPATGTPTPAAPTAGAPGSVYDR